MPDDPTEAGTTARARDETRAASLTACGIVQEGDTCTWVERAKYHLAAAEAALGMVLGIIESRKP